MPDAGAMTAWAVSPRVGNVKNNDANLIEPIAASGLSVHLLRFARLVRQC
jgi:hypothetical protein